MEITHLSLHVSVIIPKERLCPDIRNPLRDMGISHIHIDSVPLINDVGDGLPMQPIYGLDEAVKLCNRGSGVFTNIELFGIKRRKR